MLWCHKRGRPAPEIYAHGPALAPGDRLGVAYYGIEVSSVQPAVQPDSEGTEITTRPAEGDMNVDPYVSGSDQTWSLRPSSSRRLPISSAVISKRQAIARRSSARMVIILPLKSWRCT